MEGVLSQPQARQRCEYAKRLVLPLPAMVAAGISRSYVCLARRNLYEFRPCLASYTENYVDTGWGLGCQKGWGGGSLTHYSYIAERELPSRTQCIDFWLALAPISLHVIKRRKKQNASLHFEWMRYDTIV